MMGSIYKNSVMWCFDVIKVLVIASLFCCVATQIIYVEDQITKCPHPDFNGIDYNERSQILKCDVDDKVDKLYHCVDDGQHIREFCHMVFRCDKGTYLTIGSIGPAGNYPTFDDEAMLICKPCPDGEYFQSPRKSYEAQFCKDKSPCHQHFYEEVCVGGNSSEDRSCKCMYRDGYRMIMLPLKQGIKCCSRTNPDTTPCICDHAWDCDENEELNSTYDCVPKCPEGYYRPEDENRCILNVATVTKKPEVINSGTKISSSDNSVTPVAHETTKSANESDKHQDEQDGGLTIGVKVSIAVGVATAVVFLSILVYIFWKKRGQSHQLPQEDPDTTLNILHGNADQESALMLEMSEVVTDTCTWSNGRET